MSTEREVCPGLFYANMPQKSGPEGQEQPISASICLLSAEVLSGPGGEMKRWAAPVAQLATM